MKIIEKEISLFDNPISQYQLGKLAYEKGITACSLVWIEGKGQACTDFWNGWNDALNRKQIK